MLRSDVRMKAAQDIAEALGVGAQPAAPPAPVAPLPAALAPRPPIQPGMPPGMPPQGALQMGQPQAPRPISPLQNFPVFRSPPMQAALQGPQGMQGHPAMTQQTGFARGGFVVFPGR
jgi:hypothetical protein